MKAQRAQALDRGSGIPPHGHFSDFSAESISCSSSLCRFPQGSGTVLVNKDFAVLIQGSVYRGAAWWNLIIRIRTNNTTAVADTSFLSGQWTQAMAGSPISGEFYTDISASPCSSPSLLNNPSLTSLLTLEISSIENLNSVTALFFTQQNLPKGLDSVIDTSISRFLILEQQQLPQVQNATF